jgi:hypothetical protein
LQPLRQRRKMFPVVCDNGSRRERQHSTSSGKENQALTPGDTISTDFGFLRYVLVEVVPLAASNLELFVVGMGRIAITAN